MKNNKGCCIDERSELVEYRIESIVSVDERGQMVLPKVVREKLKIDPGGKIALAIMHRSMPSTRISNGGQKSHAHR